MTMKRNHVIKKYVERESEDDVPVAYHLGRLAKIITAFFLSFVALSFWGSEAFDWIDSIHPVIQFWLVFSIVCVPAGLWALVRLKNKLK